jgi:hypothetical protein
MSDDLDSILEECLSQIEEGRARPERFLFEYPDLADELRPLLQAAVEMWSVPQPALAPEARDRIEAQMLDAAAANRRLRPARTWRLAIPGHWRWALVGLSAAIVLIFLFTVLVNAAAGVLPDSPLYPLKTATEQTWLFLAPASDEPAVHMQLAERRLAEFEALASQGTYEPALLDAMIEEAEAALAEAEGLPSSVALPVLEEVKGLSERQRLALERFQASAPDPMQNRLTTALQAGDGLGERAEREMELRRSSGEPSGQDWPAPGQTWPAPGQTQVPPGQERQTPGQERGAPDVTPVPPGQTRTPPAYDRTPPGQERTPPGQEQKTPEQERELEPTSTPKPENTHKPPTNTPKPANTRKPPTSTPEP